MVLYGTVDVAWIPCGKVQFTMNLREGGSRSGDAGWGLNSLRDIVCLLCDWFFAVTFARLRLRGYVGEPVSSFPWFTFSPGPCSESSESLAGFWMNR